MVSKMIVSFAIATLLSFCSPASTFAFLPRVSRTNDAIVIDLDGLGQAPSYQDMTFYGPITNPGFVPFNPYPVRQQAEQTPSGWSYSFEYPSPPAPERQTTAPVCGAGPAITARELTRISGGTNAKKGSWPFIVALRKSDGSLFCSGSLISDTRVLLAAQCFEKMSLFEMSGVTILVGMHTSDQSDVQMTRRISKMFLHSKYNAFTYANDIAMIVMDAPVVLSKSVATVCLPPASTDPDQHVDLTIVIVIGWGKWKVTITIVLNQAKVAVIPNADCRADATIGKYVTDNVLCVTSDTNDKFTCAEDVGGPVVALPTPGAWTLIGINSYTKDCASSGLKTRVSAYREWIDQYMK